MFAWDQQKVGKKLTIHYKNPKKQRKNHAKEKKELTAVIKAAVLTKELINKQDTTTAENRSQV